MCPALIDFTDDEMSVTGLSPCIACLSRHFTCLIKSLRVSPISLAATFGISVDFFSSGYLDVSVPPVRLFNLCIQLKIRAYARGFPIRKSQTQVVFTTNLGLSQVNTSFIASDCQGIHRVRLVT